MRIVYETMEGVITMTMKKKMLPVGIENFEKIRTMNYYYVDKTGMIKELLENMTEVTLFTRPRRFGKTLNMSMLRHFFEIGNNPILFDGLAISKEEQLCHEHMGKYPVISISLKSIEGEKYEDARAMFTQIINTEAITSIITFTSEGNSSPFVK